jgi:hypothetical protein
MIRKIKNRTHAAAVLGLISLLTFPGTARSQVTDLPTGPYGGEFRDDSTGKVWLDIDALTGNFTNRLAVLSNSPFRLATTAELQSIAQASTLQNSATGNYLFCLFVPGAEQNQDCKYGVFDDSDSGTNPNLYGMFGTERGSSNVTIQPDRFDQSGANLLGTWAIQRGPALRAGTSPYGADFDGDGKDEKIVWRPSEGNWYVRFSGSNDVMVYQWGLPGDIPLVGDYDGDLIPDLVVWRPSNGTWYVKTSSSLFDASRAIQQQFGLPGDVPMKADFDGDGKLDFAVWRPSEGNWYVLQSSNHQAVVTQWGLSRDIPVTGGRDH